MLTDLKNAVWANHIADFVYFKPLKGCRNISKEKKVGKINIVYSQCILRCPDLEVSETVSRKKSFC